MKYAEIISNNRRFDQKMEDVKFNVALLSNIVLHQAKDIFEYYLRNKGINAGLTLGDYDNIVQDSFKYENMDSVILFWEPANFIDGFQYKVNYYNEKEIDLFIDKTKQEIKLTLENLETAPLVIFNKFSSLIFNSKKLRNNNLDNICNELNSFLSELNHKNLLVIDIDKVLSRVGLLDSVDFRHYYSSKSLYTTTFLEEYIKYVLPIFLNKAGKSKKALILDCDNTLWDGVVGEDGIDGIKMSSKTKEGVVFEEIQGIVSELASKGIIIGLCSKNNPKDVDEVIKNHPDFRLKEEEIVIKKVNWIDKATNLNDIANELNIGLDSIVFVDDSNFEIELIKEKLPEVTVIQRPERISDYPRVLREHLQLFYNTSISEADLKRIKDYQSNSKREELKNKFSNIEEYLKSLDLEITVRINNEMDIPRISQLTQKTNQFNLTTKRYSESEISKFISNDNILVFSISVRDKFSDSGLTSVLIIKIEGETAFVDTFLMSCRVIGRNIEYAIADYIMNYFSSTNIKEIHASYRETVKNEQVKDLYERLGFRIVRQTEDKKLYQLDIDKFKPHNKIYISVNDE